MKLKLKTEYRFSDFILHEIKNFPNTYSSRHGVEYLQALTTMLIKLENDGYIIPDECGSNEFNFSNCPFSRSFFTSPNKKEMTIKEIEDILGYDIKIIKD